MTMMSNHKLIHRAHFWVNGLKKYGHLTMKSLRFWNRAREMIDHLWISRYAHVYKILFLSLNDCTKTCIHEQTVNWFPRSEFVFYFCVFVAIRNSYLLTISWWRTIKNFRPPSSVYTAPSVGVCNKFSGRSKSKIIRSRDKYHFYYFRT